MYTYKKLIPLDADLLRLGRIGTVSNGEHGTLNVAVKGIADTFEVERWSKNSLHIKRNGEYIRQSFGSLKAVKSYFASIFIDKHQVKINLAQAERVEVRYD